jgi:hypothetical protein
MALEYIAFEIQTLYDIGGVDVPEHICSRGSA